MLRGDNMKGSVRKYGEKWSYYFTLGVVNSKKKIKEKEVFVLRKKRKPHFMKPLVYLKLKMLVSKKQLIIYQNLQSIGSLQSQLCI